MSFPAEFLDEIRSQVRVSEVVGKRIKLIKRGREFLGICPFHNDTKPSLAVVDDKNFYHCFACGAHGDIIKFTMEIEGLNFPETIEKLAALAALEVPSQSPEARGREERRKTLKDVNEEACKFYEKLLWGTSGAEGLNYLRSRGLSDTVIKRFRLGFASEDGQSLTKAMNLKGIDRSLLIEAGLIRVSERNSQLYDYFRNRVMYPIGDRRGRVIAFGARTIGDGQPKYLNSPETPLFQKGSILYGAAQAMESVTKSGEVIVTEGYMDVIALANAGIMNVVAPLGTALTEGQINELWRLAREPFVCFDGDSAGLRAAARAADRALPILKPGYSLRFVSLPLGEDPDDLIERAGIKAFNDVLAASIGLAEFVWDQEFKLRSNDTPERQADFFSRIRNRVREIADRGVQEAYRDSIEERIKDYRGKKGAYRNNNYNYSNGYSSMGSKRISNSFSGGNASRVSTIISLGRRQRQSILAAFLNHSFLVEEFGEALGYLEFNDQFLDKLRLDILDISTGKLGLDAKGLRDHLLIRGYRDDFEGVLGRDVLAHAAFARGEASSEYVRSGVRELLARIGKHQLEEQLATAQRVVMVDFNEVNWNRLSSLRAALVAVNDGSSLEDIF
jgi:DNA primase